MNATEIKDKVTALRSDARITGSLPEAVYIQIETGEVEPREMDMLVLDLETDLKDAGLELSVKCMDAAMISGWVQAIGVPEFDPFNL